MTYNYEFIQASDDDIFEIVNIYHGLIGAPGCTWDYEYPSAASAKSDIDNKSLYILKKDSKIVAVASMGNFDELDDLDWALKKPCEVMRLGVLSTLLNQGIGTVILQYVIEAAKKDGYDGIRLLVSKNNPAALALYNKNGFKKCGETFRFDLDFYCYQIKFTDRRSL